MKIIEILQEFNSDWRRVFLSGIISICCIGLLCQAIHINRLNERTERYEKMAHNARVKHECLKSNLERKGMVTLDGKEIAHW